MPCGPTWTPGNTTGSLLLPWPLLRWMLCLEAPSSATRIACGSPLTAGSKAPRHSELFIKNWTRRVLASPVTFSHKIFSWMPFLGSMCGHRGQCVWLVQLFRHHCGLLVRNLGAIVASRLVVAGLHVLLHGSTFP